MHTYGRESVICENAISSFSLSYDIAHSSSPYAIVLHVLLEALVSFINTTISSVQRCRPVKKISREQFSIQQ
jgi:hypothetical protein